MHHHRLFLPPLGCTSGEVSGALVRLHPSRRKISFSGSGPSSTRAKLEAWETEDRHPRVFRQSLVALHRHRRLCRPQSAMCRPLVLLQSRLLLLADIFSRSRQGPLTASRSYLSGHSLDSCLYSPLHPLQRFPFVFAWPMHLCPLVVRDLLRRRLFALPAALVSLAEV